MGSELRVAGRADPRLSPDSAPAKQPDSFVIRPRPRKVCWEASIRDEDKERTAQGLGIVVDRPQTETATVPTSAARVEANRKNAQLSTGPRTPEGKAVSRRNSLKHGLTGEGVVVPDEDVEAVSERFAAMEDELRPKHATSLVLVQRIALHSIRLERSARQEAARIGEAMRDAAEDFDDARLAEVESLMDRIAAAPTTNARRMRRTPEGVARLIQAWRDVDLDLQRPELDTWSYLHLQRIENLKGRKPSDAPVSREEALCKTIWGQPGYLPGEIEGMDAVERRDYARDRLRELVAGYLAELEALSATFDREALSASRAAAARIALFDDSKAAVLARKYEAATERSLLRLLKELREVEAEAADRPDVVAMLESEEGSGTLGSSSPGPIDAAEAVAPGHAPALLEGSTAAGGREPGPKSGRSRRRPRL